MTEKLLRNAVKDAQEKNQLGLLIWVNWTIWDEFALEMNSGNKDYDYVLSQISNDKDANITVEWCGFSIQGAIAVPMNKLKSEEFFTNLLRICEEGHYKGPITLIPSNEVSYFVN